MDKATLSLIVSFIGILANIYLRTHIKVLRRRQDKRDRDNVKIIVVEDDSDDVEMLEIHVFAKIVNKVEVYSTFSAFKKNMPAAPAIIIFDHYLQEPSDYNSGLDVLKMVRDKNPKNYTISYTGSENPAVFSDYVNAGLKSFISKNDPDRYRRLRTAIEQGIAECVK